MYGILRKNMCIGLLHKSGRDLLKGVHDRTDNSI